MIVEEKILKRETTLTRFRALGVSDGRETAENIEEEQKTRYFQSQLLNRQSLILYFLGCNRWKR